MAVVHSATRTTFKDMGSVAILLGKSSTTENLFIPVSVFNMNHHHNKTLIIYQHFLLLLLINCFSSVVSLHSWAPHHISEKTKAHFPLSPLSIPNFTSTKNVVEYSHLPSLRTAFSIRNSTTECNDFIKKKTSEVHQSTKFILSSSPVLPMDTSHPTKHDVIHSMEASTSLFRTTEEPPSLDDKVFLRHESCTSFPINDYTGLKNSRLLPSFTYTSGPHQVPLPTGSSHIDSTGFARGERLYFIALHDLLKLLYYAVMFCVKFMHFLFVAHLFNFVLIVCRHQICLCFFKNTKNLFIHIAHYPARRFLRDISTF